MNYGTLIDNQLYPGATRKAAGLTNAVRRVQSTATTFTKQQRTFFRNRRVCVGRDTTTIPGFWINRDTRWRVRLEVGE